MSCISEMLKLKGDKPILIPDGSGLGIEGGGSYNGYEYLVTFNSRGFRCGYIALPTGHKYESYYSYEIDEYIDSHGGITFIQNDHSLKQKLSIGCLDFWIGFDCMHGNDLRDIELAKKYFNLGNREIYHLSRLNVALDCEYSEIRSYKYVEEECKKIIDQLIKNDRIGE